MSNESSHSQDFSYYQEILQVLSTEDQCNPELSNNEIQQYKNAQS